MGRIKYISIILILTVVTLSYSFACNVLPEVVKSMTTSASKGSEQTEASKLMVGKVSQGYSRVSLSYDGKQLNNPSFYPTISGDGRYIAFWHARYDDTDYMGPINGVPIYDRHTNKLTALPGAYYEYSDFMPADLISFSADGRYIAFSSKDKNLVDSDKNQGKRDIFVHDMQNNTNKLVSVSNDNQQGGYDSENPSISPDGHYVAFLSRNAFLVLYDYWVGGNGFNHVFVRDLQANNTFAASPPLLNGNCDKTQIAADGHRVVYESTATNIVHNDENGSTADVFVSGTLVGVSSDGKQGDHGSFEPTISADGRYVAFVSASSNLAPNIKYDDKSNLFIRDLTNNTTVMVITNFGDTPVGTAPKPGKTADGMCRYPSISGDGHYVAFMIQKEDKYTIAVHDLVTNLSTKIAGGTGDVLHAHMHAPKISLDGNYIAFVSDQDNLVPGDTNGVDDVFVFHQNVNLKPPVAPGIQNIKPPLEAPLIPSSPTNKPHTLETPLQHK